VDVRKILRLSRSSEGKYETCFLNQELPSQASFNQALSTEDGDARDILETAIQGSRSSKVIAIQRELESIWQEEPSSKILIFSQFLGFLDILERCFKADKVSYARLDGKLSLKERMEVLREFGSETSSGEGAVLLISMKAGGVGLNLVSANTVFIADPWWNGAVEHQCIDRVHRIGQTARKVRVRKFCVLQSIEERILELQKRKTDLANAALGSSDQQASGTRPSLEDFKLLFHNDADMA